MGQTIMNRFGEIADELTDILEELEQADLAPEAKRLKAALERAFLRACEAERSLRMKSADQPLALPRRRAGVDTGRSAEVISLARRWPAEPAPRAAAGD